MILCTCQVLSGFWFDCIAEDSYEIAQNLQEQNIIINLIKQYSHILIKVFLIKILKLHSLLFIFLLHSIVLNLFLNVMEFRFKYHIFFVLFFLQGNILQDCLYLCLHADSLLDYLSHSTYSLSIDWVIDDMAQMVTKQITHPQGMCQCLLRPFQKHQLQLFEQRSYFCRRQSNYCIIDNINTIVGKNFPHNLFIFCGEGLFDNSGIGLVESVLGELFMRELVLDLCFLVQNFVVLVDNNDRFHQLSKLQIINQLSTIYLKVCEEWGIISDKKSFREGLCGLLFLD